MCIIELIEKCLKDASKLKKTWENRNEKDLREDRTLACIGDLYCPVKINDWLIDENMYIICCKNSILNNKTNKKEKKKESDNIKGRSRSGRIRTCDNADSDCSAFLTQMQVLIHWANGA